jgi:CO/xanthine dehydrogenase Mo-binding subunit
MIETAVAFPDIGPISKYLAVEDERIVALTGKVELGQGILTALAQIIAEELDGSVDDIAMISGATDRSPDQGVTAGSLSVEVAGEAFRVAASALKVLAERAARAKFGVGADDLSLRGTKLVNSDGQQVARLEGIVTPELLAEAAHRHALPKSPDAYRLVGQSASRTDLKARIVGAPFIHDMVLPGMRHGRIVRPPRSDARLLRAPAADHLPANITLVADGSFLGVLAKSEFQAEKAAAIVAHRSLWSEVAADLSRPADIFDQPSRAIDVVSAPGPDRPNAERRFGATYARPFIAHASIGVSCALALWSDRQLEVWSHSQGVFFLRRSLAHALRIDEAQIIVRHVPGAGCYGHNGADDAALDAALLARATPGSAVRVVWSRPDELRWSPVGSAMLSRVEVDLNADNRIAAFTLDVHSGPHGARPGSNDAVNLLAAAHLADPIPFPPLKDFPTALGGGADRNSVPLYTIPSIGVRKHIYPEIGVRTSSLRALGAPINVVAIECMMDEIANEIGEDPLAFRLRHLDDPRAIAVLRKAAEMAGWPGEAIDGIGYGLAFARYKNKAAYCALVAKVRVDEDVRLEEVWCAVDAGRVINPDGVANQVEGGIIQSASWALKEAVPFDRDGNAAIDWEHYPILTFAETPRIHVALMPRQNDPPLGVGETAQGPMQAAILNAASSALGIHLRKMPLTRDGLIEAMNA